MATPDRTALDTQLATLLASNSSITAAELRQAIGQVLDYANAATTPGEFLLSRFGFGANKSRAQNAAAYMAAQNEAAPVRGKIKFPAGTFLMDPVAYDPRVSLEGLGYNATTLNVPSGQYLFSSLSTYLVEPVGRVKDLGFIGNGVGKGAFKINAMAYFDFHACKFLGLTDYALDFRASLIGKITDCWFRETQYGIRNIGATATVAGAGENGADATGTIAGNLVTLRGCTFQAIEKVSVYWEKGSAIYITESDFETCGTNGDLNTGCIKLIDPCPNDEKIALVLDKRYTENNGGIGVDVQMGAGSTKVILRDAANWNYPNQKKNETYRVRAIGGAGQLVVYLENSDMLDAVIADVYATGNVAVENWRSDIGLHTEVNGATYVDLAAGVGTGTGDGTGSGNGTYSQAVVADSPFYYNRLNGAGASQPALVGTAPITLTGAYTTNQPSAVAATNDTVGRSVAFQGGGGSVPLDLSNAQYVALEFWAYFDPSTTGGSGGILEFGDPNWGARGGDFVYAPWIPSGIGDGIGVYLGVRQPDTSKVVEYRLPNPPAGNNWKHIGILFENGNTVKTVVNGQDVTPDVAPPTTPGAINLANDVMKFFGGTNGGRLQEFAVYKGIATNVMTSRIKAHYSARNN